MPLNFTSVKFKNYKAFRSFTLNLAGFNILVGPNNAGKSTVIGAFRILSEGMRHASFRNPERLNSVAYRGNGYRIDLSELPVSTENVFSDYDETVPAEILFSGPTFELRLIFPERDECFFVAESENRIIQRAAEFRRIFGAGPAFVPVLGPVEHNERHYQTEAARRALQTTGASRNFRNIWHHFPDKFVEFQELISKTWAGMEILRPVLTYQDGVPFLHMFCKEGRIEREIYWSGFGFQVWCQMLTFIAKAPEDALLIIDEPDIYLHSDLQRQLVHILKARSGDTLIATHSTEILSEADPADIVVINKKSRTSRRVSKPIDVRGVFSALGSSLNPMLTQLAKTRRVLFVEGNDFSILSAFARRLGKHAIANQSAFAPVPAHGFNPARVKDFADGMEQTLGDRILRGVIFDRDYRSEQTVRDIAESLAESCRLVHIHARKELENFILVEPALDRAILSRLEDRIRRGAAVVPFVSCSGELLDLICEELRTAVFGQFSASHSDQIRARNPGVHPATIHAQVLAAFDHRWADRSDRLKMIPGKAAFARFNQLVQERYRVSLTANSVIASMHQDEIPQEMREIIEQIAGFAAAGHGD